MLRLREILLLTIPCLIVLFGGIYLAQLRAPRLAETEGPWRPVIEGISVQPVTPLESALGYDLRVVVKAHEAGQTSAMPSPGRNHILEGQLGLEYRDVGKIKMQPITASLDPGYTGFSRHYGVLTEFLGQTGSDPVFPLEYLISLNKIGARGEIRLRGNCFLWDFVKIPRGGGPLPPGVKSRVLKGRMRVESQVAPLMFCFLRGHRCPQLRPERRRNWSGPT